MKRIFITALLMFAIIGIATANEDSYTMQYSVCMDKSNGITSNMLDCISAETVAQDKKLNKSYKKLRAQLTPNRKKQLLSAQRIWIQYRDANCTFYDDPDGGTMATIISNNCVLAETASRAKELSQNIEDDDEFIEEKDQKYIDIVKNGIFEFNKTTTVGQALDNWTVCNKKEWRVFKKENGVNIVQYKCFKKNSKLYSTLKNFLPENEKSDATYLNIKKLVTSIQFSINLDDTFQVYNAGTSIIWNDGLSYEESKKPLQILKKVYKNEVFDIKMINDLSAPYILQTLKFARNLAK